MSWITHFAKRPPENDGWIEVDFVTIKEYSPRQLYYWGVCDQNPFLQAELDVRVVEGELEAISTPLPVNSGQSAWLSPRGDIWIADEYNPILDGKRLLAKEGVCAPASAQEIQQSVAERLGLRKELAVIQKGYVYGEEYYKFASAVAKNAAGRFGYEINIIDSELFQWDSFPTDITEGLFDFCIEPYFLTAPRRTAGRVVQIGTIEDVTAYVHRDSPLLEAINKHRHEGLGKVLLECVGHVRAFECGFCGSTPGAAAAKRAARDYPGLVGKLKPFVDHRQLRQWIGIDPRNRIIVCDIGMAEMLDAVTAENLKKKSLPVPEGFEGQRFHFGTLLSFSMPTRLEVGYVYPTEDQIWAEIIRDSVGRALLEISGWVMWDSCEGSDSVSSDLAKIGVTALNFTEMCESYLDASERSAVFLKQQSFRDSGSRVLDFPQGRNLIARK